MHIPLLLLVVTFASFTQGIAGFGSALIAMPLIVKIFGLQVAVPLVALIVLVLEIALFIRFRRALRVNVVSKLIISSLLGIPIGQWILAKVDEDFMLSVLGVVIIAYALYVLTNYRLPRLQHPTWAYLFGFTGGLLGGAYNTSGPPVIIFGNCRRWEPAEFKANLQGFFIVSSFWIALSHGIRGNLTTEVWRLFLPSTIAIAIGLWAGLTIDKRINSELFQKIVLWLLLLLGVSLLL